MSEFFEVGIERVPLLIDRIINESKQITKENFGKIELFQDIKNMDSFCDTIWFFNLLSTLNGLAIKTRTENISRKIVKNDKDIAIKFMDTLRNEINDDFVGWIYVYPSQISPKFKQIVDEHLEKNYPELIMKEEEE